MILMGKQNFQTLVGQCCSGVVTGGCTIETKTMRKLFTGIISVKLSLSKHKYCVFNSLIISERERTMFSNRFRLN